jgi:CDP-diacylglycerol--glycerol-3-phosphate 3-phosphatidyltransferase
MKETNRGISETDSVYIVSELDKKKIYGPSALATPANLISVARIIVSPFLVILIVNYKVSWLLVGLWLAVSITDALDGYLARQMGKTSSGAFLDPLADKFAVLSAMFSLAYISKLSWFAVGIVAFREVAVSLYRTNASRSGVSVPAKNLAKLKTVFQDLTVGFGVMPYVSKVSLLVNSLLWISVVLTLITGVIYFKDAFYGSNKS